MSHRDESRTARRGGLSYRWLAGLVLVLLIVLFIVLNRDKTEISFIIFTARTSLWIALTIAGAAGFTAGYLLGRQRRRV